MITVPAKVWRPKPKDRLLAIDYTTEYNSSVFIFEKYGQAITTLPMAINVATQQDMHIWHSNLETEEFTKNFNIGSLVNPTTTQQLQVNVQKYWDCFYTDSIKFSVLHFESTVDTGTSKPYVAHHHATVSLNRSICKNSLTLSSTTIGLNQHLAHGNPYCLSPKTASRRNHKHFRFCMENVP